MTIEEQRSLNEAAVKAVGDPTALEAYYHGRTQGKLEYAREALENIAFGRVKGMEAIRREAIRGLRRSL